MEKCYRVPLAAKPGSITHLVPLCGCVQTLGVVLSSGTTRRSCVTCGQPMVVTIELTYPPGGGRLTVRRVEPGEPSDPPEGAGQPAPLAPDPPSRETESQLTGDDLLALPEGP